MHPTKKLIADVTGRISKHGVDAAMRAQGGLAPIDPGSDLRGSKDPEAGEATAASAGFQCDSMV
jgi:hypothetical protein